MTGSAQTETHTPHGIGGINAHEPLPCDVSGVRTLLAESLLRGHECARRVSPMLGRQLLRNGFALTADDLAPYGREADHVVEQLLTDAAEALPEYCRSDAPASWWFRHTLRGGLILGVEHYRSALRAQAAAGRAQSDDRYRPPIANPEWLSDTTDELLYKLLAVMSALRVVVPGAEEFLSQRAHNDHVRRDAMRPTLGLLIP